MNNATSTNGHKFPSYQEKLEEFHEIDENCKSLFGDSDINNKFLISDMSYLLRSDVDFTRLYSYILGLLPKNETNIFVWSQLLHEMRNSSTTHLSPGLRYSFEAAEREMNQLTRKYPDDHNIFLAGLLLQVLGEGMMCTCEETDDIFINEVTLKN